MDFSLSRKQLKVLKQLNELGSYLTKVTLLDPKGYSYEIWLWEFLNLESNFKSGNVKLHIIHDLLNLGLVLTQPCRYNERLTVCEISISGINYLKSLEVEQEDRLDMEKLHRIHQLVYNPMQKEIKRLKPC